MGDINEINQQIYLKNQTASNPYYMQNVFIFTFTDNITDIPHEGLF